MLHVENDNRDGDWIDGAQARFDASNADLRTRTDALLDRVATAPATHARLLNTLSMLEHMGSHKIMATQHSATIDQSTLRHVAEEAHHAYFMKRQAEKTAGRALEYRETDLLAAPSARMYFQRLEAATVRRLGAPTASGAARQDARAAYLYMSMIVELRALWFYGLYQQALKRVSLPISLKRLLGEEQNHLAEMARRLDEAAELDDERVDAFVDEERRLYERMLGALERAVG